jgi:hypothetical protein
MLLLRSIFWISVSSGVVVDAGSGGASVVTNSSNKAFASFRSRVSNPSVNHPRAFARRRPTCGYIGFVYPV